MEQLAVLVFVGIIFAGFMYAKMNHKNPPPRPPKSGGDGVKPNDGPGGDKV